MKFKKGDKVTYVPSHAHGDTNHPDCENGVVSSVEAGTGRWTTSVFVKYDCASGVAVTGDEPWTAKGTNIEDLVRR